MPGMPDGRVKTLALLAVLVVPWLLHAAVTRGMAGPLTALFAVPHAAIYLILLGLFGRTLAPGREPLVTAIARQIHGKLEPDIERYTRRVTQAWCMFFAAQLIVSALLFARAPLETWSLFVNVLNVPLLALMFAAEYGYRVIRYPDHPRVSFARVAQAFAGWRAAGGARAR